MLFGLATGNLKSFRDFYLSRLDNSSENEDYKRGYHEALDDMVNLGISTIQEQIESLPYSSVSTDKVELEKLQKQINTAVEALTEIKNAFGGATFIDSKNKLNFVNEYVDNKLAALEGGEDDRE